MARKRFRKGEVPPVGTKIQWRNVSQWHPATVSGVVETDEDGWQHVWVTNHATTRTVHSGQQIWAGPGSIRPAPTGGND